MNGHPDIDTSEATQHLKNILNLGSVESDAVGRKSLSNGDMEASDVNVGVNYARKNSFQAVFNASEDQQLILPGKEDETSICLYGQEITVYSSPLHQGAGRNKIKVENVVDHGWENKYYTGNLVCAHLSKTYLAYAIRAPNSANGFVRVIKHNPVSRALIRGLKGEVKDLAFAHSVSQVMLGCIDQVGELYVHEIVDESGKMVCNLLVHVVRYPEPQPSDHHRIIWCPYIPDDTDSLDEASETTNIEDVTSLLVATHDEKAEIWNINLLVKEYGCGEIPADTVKVGLQIIAKHKQPITTATFSPDGTALATASLDGVVKFFQVNMQECESSPRCLHQWVPHNGKPLSMLFFLDNHKNHNPDVQFWKFAITGADNNQEIKLWSCESWVCLQTIRFLPNREDVVEPCLKANLDLSSQYLFLSDISRKVLYILQIHQEPAESLASICSLTEFSLTFPVLSFAIVDVSSCKFKPLSPVTAENEEIDDKDADAVEEVDDAEKHEGSMVKLFWIHTKSLQTCRIVYRPAIAFPIEKTSTVVSLSQDSFVYTDRLSDVNMETQEGAICKSESDSDTCLEKGTLISNHTVNISSPASSLSSATLTPISSHLQNYKTCSDILLTPEDFTSPSHSTVTSTGISGNFKLPSVEESSPSLQLREKVSETVDMSNLSSESSVLPRRKSSQHSSTSSPSREVAEILAPAKLITCDDNDVDNEVNIQIKQEPAALDSIPHEDLLQEALTPDATNVIRNQADFRTNEWPQAPDLNKEYRIASRSDGIDSALQHSPREQQLLRSPHCKIEPMHEGEVLSSPDVFNSEFKYALSTLDRSVDTLSQKLTAIMDSLHTQRQEIQDVQSEIQELHNNQKYVQSNLRAVENIESKISGRVERIIAENRIAERERLDAFLSKKEDIDHQWMDRQFSSLSQNIINSVSNKLDKTVKNELKNTVTPQISKHVDLLRDQMQAEMHAKLSSADSSMKDGVAKILKSKPFNENLAQSITNQLQLHIQAACKDLFQNIVVPSVDKACQNLFLQLNDCFQRGTKEYLHHLDRNWQTYLSKVDIGMNKIHDEIKQLSTKTDTVLGTSMKKIKESEDESSRNQEALVSQFKQCLNEEIKKAFIDHSNTVVADIRSQAATPVPRERQLNLQQLMHLVDQGQLNEAFQQALSAVDLPLVISLCESVTVDEVFGSTPCPLQQHVLLSLIHQISADLHIKTDIKVRYIEDAITSLDANSHITRGHISTVMFNLQQRISLFLQKRSNHKLTRNLKRIQLAIQPLMNNTQ